MIDKWGWSYDTIAKGLVRYNHNPHLVFDIVSVADDQDFIERHHSQYDLVFALGWTLVFSKKKKDHYREELPFLDRRTLITGIHSHRSWDGYASTPEESPTPPPELLEQLSKLRGINIISRRLFTIFKNAGLTNIALTENGVDTALFTQTTRINTDRRQSLIVGFSGSKEITKHDSLKGFSEYILPLDQIPNVQIKVLGGRGKGQVPREEMPDLYNQIDLYICASTSEGFSQSVLEASACGRGVLSTRVGGCEDLIREGLNGFFFRRDLADIQSLVSRLEADRQLVKALGEANRQITEQYYSWNIKVQDWLSFIESHLPIVQPMG